jgi:hypothetical protein
MDPIHVRQAVVDRLTKDLIGPLSENEILEAQKIKPSDVYLTGILWPYGDRLAAEDDDGSQEGDDEEDESPSTATVVGMQRPCTMGISFSTAGDLESRSVSVEIKFATYTHNISEEDKGRINKWERVPFSFLLHIDLITDAGRVLKLTHEKLSANVEIGVRSLPSKHGLLSTITLINRSSYIEGDRKLNEELTLFQTSLTVRSSNNTKIIAKPKTVSAFDSDGLSNSLLYKDCHEFATGHQCSVFWDAEGDFASCIGTTWLPISHVPAYREDGDDLFKLVVESGFLEAEKLASADPDSLFTALDMLADAYQNWINQQAAEAKKLESDYLNIANIHLDRCRNVCQRIQDGINAMRADSVLRDSFQLANAAMAIQHGWKKDSFGNALKPLKWRPFQLGFILLSAKSTCYKNSEDRQILDLLWFPTGGGKTEAYLALIAMLSWYRRLNNPQAPDDGAGNAAVMRYTLRLLTAQQFERAASMILGCELIRKGKTKYRSSASVLGKVPFSIGLWVGKDATPNDFQSAIRSRGIRDGSSAEQIEVCPCCAEKVSWDYDENSESVKPYCTTKNCDLGSDFGRWSVFTVDQDIYNSSPTLLIGTVDKFAQLPLRENLSSLFNFKTDKTTDLIIQDELHLISGPLGTITGLYETAFDWLLTKDKNRPKIIGSTATIRKADEQIRALFDRQSCQFPPPGISYLNSGFAAVDFSKPWRMYVGVSTAGRSAKFTLQAVAGSLLQSGSEHVGLSDEERDGYSTLLCYFNSLRELGGAIVQMSDDVPDSIDLFSSRRGERSRRIGLPPELTSRESQKKIIETLIHLKNSAGSPDAIDVILATNMVSVGVDVPRLGLMLVNGQPKTRSEYIQSTSRVGRSKFPGLVVSVLNSAKARDRSHYETFPSWHGVIYKDIEATSVTPFASRARDKALKAVLIGMIRQGVPAMRKKPDLSKASDAEIAEIVKEIERRIKSVDIRELDNSSEEIDRLLDDWESIDPEEYLVNRFRPNQKRYLMQFAEDYAKKIASGRTPGFAWPVMNTMRNVEPSTRYRIVEVLSNLSGREKPEVGARDNQDSTPARRWRKDNA